MEFLLLGSLAALCEGRELSLGGTQQRALLAILLVHANEPVSVGRLIEGIWGETPPATATKMVQLYVSHLRKALGADGTRLLVTRAPGYMASVTEEELDLLQFDALVAQARLDAAGAPENAVERLRQGLGLWRGRVLDDLALEPFAQLTLPRLEEHRLTALEDCVDLELQLGRHAKLIGELEELVATHPTRERLQGQLMLALYRSGRQEQALAAYRDARRRLVDELALEPGPALQRLEAAILRHEPSLELLAEQDASKPRAAQVEPARKQERGRLVLAACVVVAVAIGAGAFLLLGKDEPPRAPAIVADSVAVLDAHSGRVLHDFHVGRKPAPLARAAGAVWVGNQGDRTVVKIDQQTKRVTATFGLPEVPTELATSGDVVWVGNGYSGTISKIIARYGFLSGPMRPRRGVYGFLAMAASPRNLWVGLQSGRVVALDPESFRLTGTIATPRGPAALVLGGGSLWETLISSGDLVQLDPERLELVRRISLAGSSGGLAYWAGNLWVAVAEENRLWRIDPQSGHLIASVATGSTPVSIAAGKAGIWVACRNGDLLRVDPTTTTLEVSVHLGHSVADAELFGDELWVTVNE